MVRGKWARGSCILQLRTGGRRNDTRWTQNSWFKKYFSKPFETLVWFKVREHSQSQAPMCLKRWGSLLPCCPVPRGLLSRGLTRSIAPSGHEAPQHYVRPFLRHCCAFSEKIQEIKKSWPKKLRYVKKIIKASSYTEGEIVISQKLMLEAEMWVFLGFLPPELINSSLAVSALDGGQEKTQVRAVCLGTEAPLSGVRWGRVAVASQ